MSRAKVTAAILALLLWPAAALAICPWPTPGANPYTGPKAEAVRRMEQIPADIREVLAQSVEDRTYSAQAEFRADGVYVNGRKSPHWTGLSDMNFGADGRVCRGAVDASMWAAGKAVGMLIHHHRGYSVAVMSECGNVALVNDNRAAAAMVQRVHSVPEPSSLWLVLLGLVGALLGVPIYKQIQARHVRAQQPEPLPWWAYPRPPKGFEDTDIATVPLERDRK